MGHLLCEEKRNHKESVRKHTEENMKLKKEVSMYKEQLKKKKPAVDHQRASLENLKNIFHIDDEAQGIEVLYNEEVTAVENNTTIEDEFDFNRTIEDEVSCFLVLFFSEFRFLNEFFFSKIFPVQTYGRRLFHCQMSWKL